MSGQSLVPRRLVRASAVVLGSQRVRDATLTAEVTKLNRAVHMYPSTIQLGSTQQTQETLTRLVRFQINSADLPGAGSLTWWRPWTGCAQLRGITVTWWEPGSGRSIVSSNEDPAGHRGQDPGAVWRLLSLDRRPLPWP